METKFTKGPYRVIGVSSSRSHTFRVISEREDENLETNLCAVESGLNATALSTEEAFANATLFAAAPDLFAALQMAETWLEGWASAETELAIIKRVLAKATGAA